MNDENIEQNMDMLEIPYWLKVVKDVMFSTICTTYEALHEVNHTYCSDEQLNDLLEGFELHEFCKLDTNEWTIEIFWPNSQILYSITDRDDLKIQVWDRDNGNYSTFCNQPVINNFENLEGEDVMAFIAKASAVFAIKGEVLHPEACEDCGCLFEEDSEAA